MIGSLGVVADQQFFEELFALVQADDPDGDVAPGGFSLFGVVDDVGFQPMQADHALGKIQNLHGIAHIQHEDVASLGHRAGLYHKLRCLGDRHEKARDLTMGHRDGTTMFDLRPETRDHRSGRPKHVSEADHRESGPALLGRDRLAHQFCHPLGGAHEICRTHRLVGRDQDEVFDTLRSGRVGQNLGSEDVVDDAVHHVLFDQHHMFVGCRVIDGLHAEGTQNGTDPARILNRPEDGLNSDGLAIARQSLAQFGHDRIERDFGDLEHNERRGIVPNDLTA